MAELPQIQSAYTSLIASCLPFDVGALPFAMGGPVEALACPGWASLSSLCCLLEIPGATLSDAGIVVQNANRSELHAGLAVPGEPLLPLRDGPRGPIVDILTPGGLLSGGLPILEDAATRGGHPGTDKQLLVVFDVRDLITVRSWGLAATLATGLDRLDPLQVAALMNKFGLSMHAGNHPTIIFVGWSPASMSASTPAGLDEVLRHWAELQDFVGLRVGDVGLWKVNEHDLRCLRFLRNFGDAARLRKEVLREIGDAPEFSPPPPPPVQATFTQARGALISVMTGKTSVDEFQKASLAYRHAVAREIQPLLESAGRETSPQAHDLVLLRALLMELVHLQAPIIGAALINEYGNSMGPSKVLQGRMQSHLQAIDRLIQVNEKLKKEVT